MVFHYMSFNLTKLNSTQLTSICFRSEPALELVVEDEFDEEDDQNQLADQVKTTYHI